MDGYLKEIFFSCKYMINKLLKLNNHTELYLSEQSQLAYKNNTKNEHQSEFQLFSNESLAEFRHYLPQLFRKSMYLMAFSMLESELIQFCKYHSKENPEVFEKLDKSNNGLILARKYLIKQNILLPHLLVNKKVVINYYCKINNIIKHNNGVIKDENIDLLCTHSKNINYKHLLTISCFKVKFEFGFLENFIREIDKTFDELSNQFDIDYKELKLPIKIIND